MSNEMPDTLTLEQAEHLRRTLPQQDFGELMGKTIDIDRIIKTQIQVIDGKEVFVPDV